MAAMELSRLAFYWEQAQPWNLYQTNKFNISEHIKVDSNKYSPESAPDQGETYFGCVHQEKRPMEGDEGHGQIHG